MSREVAVEFLARTFNMILKRVRMMRNGGEAAADHQEQGELWNYRGTKLMEQLWERVVDTRLKTEVKAHSSMVS